ncbi:6-phosphogluconate dehydrogenase C-terminal domain-like protein [Saccharata proteae CBS 121410]|uniref:6-phosphogluconate dehydrogenase C-terminal domain-like protein n=1 Tax=Saccharata proteae CBS 121410 TaxID=1314787 RepID=A0A9P4HKN7_9PEZI|nr:6-phosphogluconate dehydrogenase C-terminal domain-like protein [Saccharata proteae CBS 121410]
MASTRAKVGVLSIGEMGLGIAKLLQANNYHVYTTLIGRSPNTAKRAESAGIEVLEDDVALVSRSDYIFSIVPPRDAVPTAERIIAAHQDKTRGRRTDTKAEPLYYLDLNAIAPTTARHIARELNERAPEIRFLDGGIIGPPPSPPAEEEGGSDSAWKRPSIPLSGPHSLGAAPTSGRHLFETLNAKDLGDGIGSASGLKASFAALTKGFTGLAIQSFSTAARMGVLPQLQQHLAEFSPAIGELAGRGVIGMPSKAYRWVGEMEEIGNCFREEGGWGGGESVFGGIAEVYRFVADETGLGSLEGRRPAGEVVEGIVDGLEKRRERGGDC